MSVHVIYMEKGRKVMRPILTKEEYRALRGAQRQHNLVYRARQGYTGAKGLLLQMNYSCMPGSDMHLRGCTTASNTVGMDVDLSPEAWEEELVMGTVRSRILEQREALGLRLLERSATKGYHLVFARRAGLSQEENLRWASGLVGVKYDEGAKDITRVFYTTTDSAEDLLFLDERLFEQGVAGAPAEQYRELREVRELREEETAPTLPTLPALPTPAAAPAASANYLGIPYGAIIEKWWQLHYEGHTPIKSNRNTLTYELALNLRHICDFDAALLEQVIPLYDGFTAEERRACIASALDTRRTQMPRRLLEVLEALRREHADDAALVAAVDALQARRDNYYADHLTARPMGISESLAAVAPSMAMPMLMAVCPVIGGLASEVRLMVHGVPNSLNLCSYICGEAGSGKGSIDPVVSAWLRHLQGQDDAYHAEHELWRQTMRSSKNKQELPPEPKLPIRVLTLNNTVANLAERLANTKGLHCISFTPEADTVAQRWKSSMSDFSVMLRQAYDASRYDREARSVDAVSVHIEALRWNVTMCGTEDALYHVVANTTDGLLSRMAIARTPDNTFLPLDEEVKRLTEAQGERIAQVALLLPLMRGRVELPKLEARSRAWVEEVRMEAMKNDDRVMARCRLRDHVTAYRMTTCVMLCAVAEQLIEQYGAAGAMEQLKSEPECWIPLMEQGQTEAMMAMYDLVADALMEGDLHFFRDKLEKAYSTGNNNNVTRTAKNSTIYAKLAAEFDTQEAAHHWTLIKGVTPNINTIHQMLCRWQQQGLIERIEAGRYRKNQ